MCLWKLSITFVNWSGIDVFRITWGHILKLRFHCQWTMEQAGNKTLCCYCWVNIASMLLFLFWIFSKVFLRKATVIWSLKSTLLTRMLLVVAELLRLSSCSSWVSLSSSLVWFSLLWIGFPYAATQSCSLSHQRSLSCVRRFAGHC